MILDCANRFVRLENKQAPIQEGIESDYSLSGGATASLSGNGAGGEEFSFGEIDIQTVSKRAQKASDAPAVVYAVTDRQIKERGYNNLAELLEDIPEVEFNKRTAGEYGNFISMRGIAGSEKFVILLDGYRYNSPSGGPFMIGPQYSLANVKQVEVVLGPASALYGADAFAGIVNIITKKGNELSGGSLAAGFGGYNTTDNSFTAGYPLSANEDVSLMVSGQRYNSNEPNFPELYPKDYEWFNTKYKKQGRLRATPFSQDEITTPFAGFEIPTEGYSLNLKLNIRDFEVGYARNYLTYSAGLGWRPEFTLFQKDILFGNLMETMWAQYAFQSFDGKWESKTSLSKSANELPTAAKFLNTYSSYQDAFKYGYENVVRLEEQVNYNIAEAVSLTAGGIFEDFASLPQTSDLPFEYDKNRAADAQNIYYIGTDIKDRTGRLLLIQQDVYNIDFQNVGGYAQLQAKTSPKVELTVGGRYDHDTRFGGSFNPRAGLVYTPSRGVKAKLLYGEAFLAPSPTKSYQHFGSFFPLTDSLGRVKNLASAFWRLPSLNLKPEKLRSYEGSFAYFTEDGFGISFNGYYTKIDNLIVNSGKPNVDFKGVVVQFVQSPTNRGSANNYGGTAKVEARFDAGQTRVNPYLAYSYSDGDIEGEKLIYSAKHTIKAGCDARFGNLSVSPRLLYRSSSFHPAKDGKGLNYKNDSFAVVNLYARYSNLIASANWKAAAFFKIDNLFDARYYHLGSAADLGTASFIQTPQDPRRIMAGVALELGLIKESQVP